jgi:hypothetical protein
MTNRRGAAGLTLLEVVIALSILSVIGIIAVEAMRIGTRAWARGERQAEQEQHRRVLAWMLTGDLAAMQPVTVQLSGRPVVGFRGEPERVLFYTAPELREPLPLGAMVRSVAYSVESGKGLVVQRAYFPLEGKPTLEPGDDTAVLHPEVTRLRLRYLSPGEVDAQAPRWVESWEPEETAASPPVGARPGRNAPPSRPSRGLPLAVEVRLTLGPAGAQQELVLMVPVRVSGGL